MEISTDDIWPMALMRDPRTAIVGLLVEFDMGPFKQHSVLWFSSKEEISQFLLYSFPVLCGFDPDYELDESDEIMPLIEKAIDSDLSNEAVDDLSEYTTTGNDIYWVGSFNDLCNAGTGPAKELIEMFRSNSETKGKIISDSEREEFIEFLVELANQ